MTAVKYSPKVEIVPNPESLAARCVEIFFADAIKAIDNKGVFYVAISGGRTPEGFFRQLGQIKPPHNLIWDKIQLFWVDERYVPIDSPYSNYRLAQDTFLNKVSIPKENIHRIYTDYSNLNEAASAYEENIRSTFAIKKSEFPNFDLIILGMGADGHTGSLFADSNGKLNTNKLTAAVYVNDEKFNRITLTCPVLRAASHLVVLISGTDKASILKTVLTGKPDEIRYPIHVLWPVLDKVTWLIDNAAAQHLKK
jgi:6-phosphogluconolactonase